MKNKRIWARIVACVLIYILPVNTFAMEKEDFFRYLINTSYPEAETNAEEGEENKEVSNIEEKDDYIKFHIGQENIPTIGTNSEEDGKAKSVFFSQYENNIKITSSTPRMLIYHSHSAETYSNSPEGNYHSQDVENSVMKVGNILTNELSNKGWGVVHNTTYHDYPSYNNSYSNSLKTIKSMISEYNSIDIAIDLHRDASANVDQQANKNYTTTINGEKVAQICFVVGMKNENVDKVMNTATELTNLANKMYPGIAKAVVQKQYGRYNQYVAENSILIEVGSNATSTEEASASAKYIANILDSYFK